MSVCSKRDLGLQLQFCARVPQLTCHAACICRVLLPILVDAKRKKCRAGLPIRCGCQFFIVVERMFDSGGRMHSNLCVNIYCISPNLIAITQGGQGQSFYDFYPCFSPYSFRKETLSSQLKLIFFILPSWEIKLSQAAERTSAPTSPDTTSLATNDGELGDSVGGRRRIDIVNGLRAVAKENAWRSGFSVDGMECDNVGDKVVGGSYLHTINPRVQKRLPVHTYRIHITNTLYPLTGTTRSSKTSANLSRPRPLLVVHSGKITRGRFAVHRISSRLV